MKTRFGKLIFSIEGEGFCFEVSGLIRCGDAEFLKRMCMSAVKQADIEYNKTLEFNNKER